jgi:hypothetical protein
MTWVFLECRRLQIQDDCDTRADKYFDHFEAMLVSACARYPGIEDKVYLKDYLVQEDEVTPLFSDDDFINDDDEPVTEEDEDEVEPPYDSEGDSDINSDDEIV